MTVAVVIGEKVSCVSLTPAHEATCDAPVEFSAATMLSLRSTGNAAVALLPVGTTIVEMMSRLAGMIVTVTQPGSIPAASARLCWYAVRFTSASTTPSTRISCTIWSTIASPGSSGGGGDIGGGGGTHGG